MTSPMVTAGMTDAERVAHWKARSRKHEAERTAATKCLLRVKELIRIGHPAIAVAVIDHHLNPGTDTVTATVSRIPDPLPTNETPTQETDQ